MAGHSASKTRVNALVSRPSTSCLLNEKQKDVDARHKAGHDEPNNVRIAKEICAGRLARAWTEAARRQRGVGERRVTIDSFDQLVIRLHSFPRQRESVVIRLFVSIICAMLRRSRSSI